MAIEPNGLGFSQWYRNWEEKAFQMFSNEPFMGKLAVGMIKGWIRETMGGKWKEE